MIRRQKRNPQPVHEEVLLTVLLEMEAILNSKPLGYVSADIVDINPVTPNSLLMGQPDGSLPQVVYPETEIPSCRHWRHSQILGDQFTSRFIRNTSLVCRPDRNGTLLLPNSWIRQSSCWRPAAASGPVAHWTCNRDSLQQRWVHQVG